MKCVACGKEGTKKDFLLSEDKQMYCVNPFTCNEEHPNSVPNIIARGAAVKMFTEEELETSLFDRLQISDEMKDRIIKVATKPQSIRLSKLEIAHYLLELQDKKELASISESVRYCVLYAMKHIPISSLNQNNSDVPRDEVESPDIVTETNGGLTGIVVPDMPKSINVDWSKLPEPEKEEEEKFRF